jgi:hypothetical protein
MPDANATVLVIDDDPARQASLTAHAEIDRAELASLKDIRLAPGHKNSKTEPNLNLACAVGNS